MSFSRENVIWRSNDGTWNRGFYEVAYQYGDDPEWDVEYDFSSFQWVSTGHKTEEAAWRSWDGANPGGCSILENPDLDSDEADQYDKMAKEYLEANPPVNRYKEQLRWAPRVRW